MGGVERKGKKEVSLSVRQFPKSNISLISPEIGEGKEVFHFFVSPFSRGDPIPTQKLLVFFPFFREKVE